MKIKSIQTKLKLIILTLLSASALNLPAFADIFCIEDGEVVVESDRVYDATQSSSAIDIFGHSSYTGTNIKASSILSHGAVVVYSSTLSLIDSTVTTTADGSTGIHINNESSGTLRNVTIETKGKNAYGVSVTESTLTLTDSNISATGNNSNALYVSYYSTGTVNLNHNTLTGNILVLGDSTLNLIGSNGTVITGNITANVPFDAPHYSIANLTLTGEGSKIIGNVAQDASSTITLDISDGAAFIGSGTVSNLTLGDDAILGYTGNGPLVIETTLTIGDGILIDFSNITVEDSDEFTILDWTSAELVGEVTVGQFTATNLGPDMDGTFTVSETGLTFNATAVPEPSVYILLGIGLGILLITAHRRRRVQS
jgi:hypothetical protein